MPPVKSPADGKPPRRRRGRPDEGAREKLVQAATSLFIERDYHSVATDDILRRAGVSRGAMYHHFGAKLDLFEAVYERGESELVAQFAETMGQTSTPYETLVGATSAYLTLCETSPYLRRIGLGQARTVLGWERWRHAAMRHGLGLVIALFHAAMHSGELQPRDPEIAGQLLLATLIEGALLVIAAADPPTVRADVEELLHIFLDGLRTSR